MITNGVSKILLCTRIYCYYNLSDGNSIEIHDFYRKQEWRKKPQKKVKQFNLNCKRI